LFIIYVIKFTNVFPSPGDKTAAVQRIDTSGAGGSFTPLPSIVLVPLFAALFLHSR